MDSLLNIPTHFSSLEILRQLSFRIAGSRSRLLLQAPAVPSPLRLRKIGVPAWWSGFSRFVFILIG